MSAPALYAHPFSSYCQKAFIAFYEKDVPFELRLLSSQNPSVIAERHALWPLDRFPVLHANGQTIAESSVIIEWLDHRHSATAPLIPADPDAALEVRMLDRIFDNYVMNQAQVIFFDRARPEAVRDPHGVGLARAMLDRAYRWIDDRMASREWAAANDFSLADCAAAPALFYASWAHPFGEYPALSAYYQRLLARPSFERCVEGGRPYRHLSPISPPSDCR
jgi:glutathione S-transferase